MSEERLNEIKDSIDFQLRVCEINNYETDMIIEEKELYNEVLSNKILIQELRDTIDNQREEIDRLNKEYERIYNENCKLRENHNINDITLLDENERLNRIIDNIFKFMQNKYDNSDLTGFTISFMELQDLKQLKENK